ncbi:MAG: hypothetical protein AAGA48_09935 [Myxococcota bacterium]
MRIGFPLLLAGVVGCEHPPADLRLDGLDYRIHGFTSEVTSGPSAEDPSVVRWTAYSESDCSHNAPELEVTVEMTVPASVDQDLLVVTFGSETKAEPTVEGTASVQVECQGAPCPRPIEELGEFRGRLQVDNLYNQEWQFDLYVWEGDDEYIDYNLLQNHVFGQFYGNESKATRCRQLLKGEGPDGYRN